MGHFDDDWNDDFDENDFGDEGHDLDSHTRLPVFQKAMEIADITVTICDLIEPGKDRLHMREMMPCNAYVLGAKIAGAEGGDLYSIRFDNATLIKLAARELLAQTSLLRAEKLVEEQYIDLLRKEIEEFRKLFLDWVRNFDKNNDIRDEWDIKGL
ncbi:MAG TPA: hypothetical protein VI112_14785 [Bacteroidia bacterium]|jgi:hypothetical protein